MAFERACTVRDYRGIQNPTAVSHRKSKAVSSYGSSAELEFRLGLDSKSRRLTSHVDLEL